jgi:predicted MFS family arabinose efflux permease
MTNKSFLVLICGATILTLAMGIRQTFGLFLSPMSIDLGVGRETFALAMAIQNILWGVAQPFAGMIADKYGAVRVLFAGTATYVVGLVVMSEATDAWGLTLGGGLFIGLAMSCTSFAVVLGAVSRAVPEERRSMALGIASAGGSFGQFIMAPVGQGLIASQGWVGALFSMAFVAAAMAPLAIALANRRPSGTVGSAQLTIVPSQTIREALGEAGRNGSYWYLTTGFFVCGFQVVFIAVHFPAYLTDIGLSASLGATALALIGFFNIIGTWTCGALGGRFSKKNVLSILYTLRSLVIMAFLVAPKNETSVLVFASAIGLLWLGTVPLTSGLVAQIFGVRYMSTLFGIVFFGHQVGSFLGVWLGGAVFDRTGSYDSIWIASILLGFLAAALHLPIVERPLRAAQA